MARPQIIMNQPDWIGRWVMERMGATWTDGRGTAIGLVSLSPYPDRELHRVRAGVVFEGWNGASLNMHVAAEPGAHWLTPRFLHACIWYPFGQLGARKVVGLVGSANAEALRFDQKLGFRIEATLEDAHPDGALVVLTMDRKAAERWLNLRERFNGKALRTAAA